MVALQSLVAGYTVYNHRMTSIPRVQLPALSVYSTEESVQRSNMAGALERTLTIVIDVLDSSTDDTVQDRLDNVSVEIEKVMQTAFNSTPLEEFYLTGTDLAIDEDGNAQVGALSMEYMVRYRTDEDDPETLLE